MRVVRFGAYSTRAEYPRTGNLIQGLQAANVDVLECRYAMAQRHEERVRSVVTSGGVLHYCLRLLASYSVLSWRFLRCSRAEAVVVAYPAFSHLHLVRAPRFLAGKRTIIIHDAFLPLYDSLAHDRKFLAAGGVAARLVRALEVSLFRVGDLNLVDTKESGDHLFREYGGPPSHVY